MNTSGLVWEPPACHLNLVMCLYNQEAGAYNSLQ